MCIILFTSQSRAFMGDTEDEPFCVCVDRNDVTQITLIVKLHFSINRKSYHLHGGPIYLIVSVRLNLTSHC